MELRQLRYFVAVARELNFTRAAQILHMAQPALSRQVASLEEELGFDLLERNPAGVTLTPAGATFLNQAELLLAQSETAVDLARKASEEGKSGLNIGYVWGLFHSTMTAPLLKFRRAAPDVAIHLHDLTSTEQAKALVDGKLDAGLIGFAYEADAARLSKKQIGTCQFLAALPKDHWLSRKMRIEIADLANERFLMISEEGFPGAAHVMMEACRKAGFKPKVVQMPARGHTILGLVAASPGVALIPEPLAALPHKGVEIRTLYRPLTSDLYIAWDQTRMNPTLKILLQQWDAKK